MAPGSQAMMLAGSFIPPNQIKQHGSLQRASLIGDVQGRSGQVLKLAPPNADDRGIGSFAGCADAGGNDQNCCEAQQQIDRASHNLGYYAKEYEKATSL